MNPSTMLNFLQELRDHVIDGRLHARVGIQLNLVRQSRQTRAVQLLHQGGQQFRRSPTTLRMQGGTVEGNEHFQKSGQEDVLNHDVRMETEARPGQPAVEMDMKDRSVRPKFANFNLPDARFN